MKYPALVIANYFINMAKQADESLTPMKLIKLVYFAHGWNLALRHQPLIAEQVEAWRYGPVIPSIYQYFKKFGNEEITELAPVEKSYDKKLYDDDITLKLLNRIWEVYGHYSAIQLTNLTHEKNSPWDVAWHEQSGKATLSYPISDQLMSDFFSSQAKQK